MATNRAELNKTLKILRETGRVEGIDAAVVQMLRSMADAVDENPQNAALWRQYREALAGVMSTDDDADSDLNQALAEIRSTAEVGD